MANLKIKAKLMVSFGSVMLFMLILSAASIYGFNSIGKAEESMMKDQYPSVRQLLQIRIDSNEMHRQLYDHIITTDDEKTEEIEAAINENFESINSTMKEYENNITDETEQQDYDMFKTAWNEYSTFFKQVIILSESDEDEVAYDMMFEGAEVFSKVENALEKCINLNDQYLNNDSQRIEKMIMGSKYTIFFVILISFAVAAAAITLIVKNMTKSTAQILGFLEEASKGELNNELIMDTKDELGMIGEKSDSLVKSLRDMISEVANVAENVAASSEELSATAEETSAITEEVTRTINTLAEGAGEQSQSVQEANNNMDSISKNINYIVKTNEYIMDSTNKVLDATNDGVVQADKAINQIRKIEESTENTVGVINELNSQSEKIGQIVEVIKDLADQTNLLALNAAIEAARAGEQGKGFAVVAEEVKKLAEESSSSAEEISNLIQNIQNQTKEAVKITEMGGTEVSHGVKAVEVASASFETIMEEINVVVKQIKSGYKLSQNTLEESEAIVETIKNINNIAIDAAASTEEVSASAQEQNASMESVVDASEKLAELGNNLQELINKFHI